MNDIRVSKQELIERLKDNRSKHREVFEDALEGYRKEVIKQLESRLEDARSGRKVNLYIGLVQPEDHTKDYDAVIDMMEMSVDDTISLPVGDFRAYVRDEWNWKQQFIASTSMYNSPGIGGE